MKMISHSPTDFVLSLSLCFFSFSFSYGFDEKKESSKKNAAAAAAQSGELQKLLPPAVLKTPQDLAARKPKVLRKVRKLFEERFCISCALCVYGILPCVLTRSLHTDTSLARTLGSSRSCDSKLEASLLFFLDVSLREGKGEKIE